MLDVDFHRLFVIRRARHGTIGWCPTIFMTMETNHDKARKEHGMPLV